MADKDNYDYLLEEYKLIVSLVVSTEESLNKWQNIYLLVNGLAVTILTQVIAAKFSVVLQLIIVLMLCIFTVLANLQWTRLTGRSLLYLAALEKRQVACEAQLHKRIRNAYDTAEPYIMFGLRNAVVTFVKDRANNWRNNKSTFEIRRQFPFTILIVWVFATFMILGWIGYSIYSTNHLAAKSEKKVDLLPKIDSAGKMQNNRK